MKRSSASPPAPDERAAVLERTRNKNMARSPHAFVRGNTVQFYDWLSSLEGDLLPPVERHRAPAQQDCDAVYRARGVEVSA